MKKILIASTAALAISTAAFAQGATPTFIDDKGSVITTPVTGNYMLPGWETWCPSHTFRIERAKSNAGVKMGVAPRMTTEQKVRGDWRGHPVCIRDASVQAPRR